MNLSTRTSLDAPRSRGLTTPKIVFFVIAATTPMAVMVGTLPVALSLGTGPGMPAAFVLAGLVMLCFISGYAAMSRNIVNTGALYSYIRAGLGRIPGAGAAYLAVLSYSAFTIGVVGGFGYFAQLILDLPGVPWPCYSAVLVLLIAVVGRRRVNLSVWMLGILITAEIAILLVMDGGIAAHRGVEALPAVSFSPAVALGTGLAAALTFAFTSFIGVESAALYGEEARDPRRSVPLAGYWSVAIVTVFYGLTSWLVVGGIGANDVRAKATKEGGELVFNLTTQYTATALTAVMAILMVTTFIATGVAVHNATSRYIFALGREGLLPRWLGHRHAKFDSPARASDLQTLLSVLVVGGFAAAGLHPYLNLAVSMMSLATIGVMVLMLGASVSVVAFFVRRPAERHWWRTAVAPVLAALGLGTATLLVLAHYSFITGTDSALINGLPWLILVVVFAGAGRALWLRARDHAAFAAMHPEAVALTLDAEPTAA
jgi:amino acid transporter